MTNIIRIDPVLYLVTEVAPAFKKVSALQDMRIKMKRRAKPEDMTYFTTEKQVVFSFVDGITNATYVVNTHMTSFKVPSDRQSIITATPDEDSDFVRNLESPDIIPYHL
ncbi:hypothetical protein PS1_018926 [Malus domestica]